MEHAFDEQNKLMDEIINKMYEYDLYGRFKSEKYIDVNVSDISNTLSENIEVNRYYFVHNYYFLPNDSSHILGKTNYIIDFVSCIKKDNIFGVQFHPEKSHKYGMALFKKFASY